VTTQAPRSAHNMFEKTLQYVPCRKETGKNNTTKTKRK